jgi:hypothetical protein
MDEKILNCYLQNGADAKIRDPNTNETILHMIVEIISHDKYRPRDNMSMFNVILANLATLENWSINETVHGKTALEIALDNKTRLSTPPIMSLSSFPSIHTSANYFYNVDALIKTLTLNNAMIVTRLDWSIKRLLFIGYYKERSSSSNNNNIINSDNNNNCYIGLLPKDILLLIIKQYCSEYNKYKVSKSISDHFIIILYLLLLRNEQFIIGTTISSSNPSPSSSTPQLLTIPMEITSIYDIGYSIYGANNMPSSTNIPSRISNTTITSTINSCFVSKERKEQLYKICVDFNAMILKEKVNSDSSYRSIFKDKIMETVAKYYTLLETKFNEKLVSIERYIPMMNNIKRTMIERKKDLMMKNKPATALNQDLIIKKETDIKVIERVLKIISEKKTTTTTTTTNNNPNPTTTTTTGGISIGNIYNAFNTIMTNGNNIKMLETDLIFLINIEKSMMSLLIQKKQESLNNAQQQQQKKSIVVNNNNDNIVNVIPNTIIVTDTMESPKKKLKIEN